MFSVVALFFLLTCLAGAQSGFVNTLMPQPQSLSAFEGWLPITPSFSVSLEDSRNPLLKAAVQRTLTHLESMAGIELSRDI
jgi:hypothetical protein